MRSGGADAGALAVGVGDLATGAAGVIAGGGGETGMFPVCATGTGAGGAMLGGGGV